MISRLRFPVFQSEWVGIDEACDQLSISRVSFWRLRRDAVLRCGVHWYRHSGRLMVNPEACRLALRVHSIARQR